jgi:hypothetical protein
MMHYFSEAHIEVKGIFRIYKLIKGKKKKEVGRIILSLTVSFTLCYNLRLFFLQFFDPSI